MSARIVKVILSNDVLLGEGTPDSILRRPWTLYTLDGQRVGQWDTIPDSVEQDPETWFDYAQLSRLMSEGE